MRFWQKIIFLFFFLGALQTAEAAITQPLKDSTVKTYHQNGELKEKGKYRDGNKHGIWVSYDENGAITRKVKYKKGEFWWEKFYEKGKLMKIVYKNGKVVKMKACGC